MLEKRSKLKGFVEVSESSDTPIEVYESLRNIEAHSITDERSTLYISIVEYIEYIDVYCIYISIKPNEKLSSWILRVGPRERSTVSNYRVKHYPPAIKTGRG